MDTTRDKILADINDAISPKVMNQKMALDWLEDLVCEVESIIDGIKDDLMIASIEDTADIG